MLGGFTNPILPAFSPQGAGERGAALQKTARRLDGIGGDGAKDDGVLFAQCNQDLRASLEAYLLPEGRGDDHLPLRRGADDGHRGSPPHYKVEHCQKEYTNP